SQLKAARNYGGASYAPAPAPSDAPGHQQFGHIVASCEGADLRPLAGGVEIYADTQREFEALPTPAVPRSEVIDELYAAVMLGHAPLHGGAWARATTEACLAILDSARTRTPQFMRLQVATR
ncbi:MAG: gfo/Idh/MocA family oxidoreductase, partial [Variovorax sp.]